MNDPLTFEGREAVRDDAYVTINERETWVFHNINAIAYKLRIELESTTFTSLSKKVTYTLKCWKHLVCMIRYINLT